MKDFLKKIIEGNGASPSELCLQAFHTNFSDAINVEWFRKKEGYETVFYRNSLEHIALFSPNGILLEYRQNLPTPFLPQAIRDKSLEKGEIMNSVLKNKGNVLEYEIIARDTFGTRYLLLFSDTGEVQEEKEL